MTIYINGTTGISGVDGSAGTPAVQGTDTNTGVFYPAADTVGVSTGGSERMRVDSSGNVGIGTSSPVTVNSRLTVTTGITAQDSTTPALQLYNPSAGSDQKYLRIISTTTGTFNFEKVNDAYSSATVLFGVTTAGLFQFNSGYGSVATAYGCRAWVNFNGTSTVAIRASGNVTSITDNGVGDYTVNFTNAMPDANYSVSTCHQSIGGANKGATAQYELTNPATGSCRLVCFSNGATSATADPIFYFASFFR